MTAETTELQGSGRGAAHFGARTDEPPARNFLPDTWTFRTLRSCLRRTPEYGINAAAVEFDDRLPAYLRITDIADDGRYDPSPKVSVSHPLADRYFLEDGDLVFARTGASVGKAYKHDPNDGPLVYAGFLIRVTPNPDVLLSDYLGHYVRSKPYWDWVRTVSMRSGQPGINGQEYGGLTLVLPPVPEQHAIAAALSDIDGLIAALNALIAKKRAIKQAAMQQLITGKTRLPGFEGEWDVAQIQDVASVKTGPFGSLLHEEDYVLDGTPIITVEHLNEFRVSHSNVPMVSEQDRHRLRAYSLRENDIVFSRVGSIDRNALIRPSEAGWLFSGRLLRVRANLTKVSAPFLSYQFHADQFKQKVKNVAVGQTMPSLNTQILKGIEIDLPPLPEQQAIAQFLSDMDAEIEALEARVAKTRDIKQGMMQQLLTGRVRLPVPATTEESPP